ncbi:hypothetical protein HDU97_005851 [Phlyctochytrium planicorne]|nr:hypothetical protein HDU97_005851 [Phlyctochytrium planicorne]
MDGTTGGVAGEADGEDHPGPEGVSPRTGDREIAGRGVVEGEELSLGGAWTRRGRGQGGHGSEATKQLHIEAGEGVSDCVGGGGEPFSTEEKRVLGVEEGEEAEQMLMSKRRVTGTTIDPSGDSGIITEEADSACTPARPKRGCGHHNCVELAPLDVELPQAREGAPYRLPGAVEPVPLDVHAEAQAGGGISPEVQVRVGDPGVPRN